MPNFKPSPAIFTSRKSARLNNRGEYQVCICSNESARVWVNCPLILWPQRRLRSLEPEFFFRLCSDLETDYWLPSAHKQSSRFTVAKKDSGEADIRDRIRVLRNKKIKRGKESSGLLEKVRQSCARLRSSSERVQTTAALLVIVTHSLCDPSMACFNAVWRGFHSGQEDYSFIG